jgi:hypothetical protein
MTREKRFKKRKKTQVGPGRYNTNDAILTKNPRYVSFYKYKRFEEDNDPDKRIGPGAYYDGIDAM